MSRVTIDIKQTKEDTKVTITQTGVPSKEVRKGYVETMSRMTMMIMMTGIFRMTRMTRMTMMTMLNMATMMSSMTMMTMVAIWTHPRQVESTREGWQRYYFHAMKRSFGFGSSLF